MQSALRALPHHVGCVVPCQLHHALAQGLAQTLAPVVDALTHQGLEGGNVDDLAKEETHALACNLVSAASSPCEQASEGVNAHLKGGPWRGKGYGVLCICCLAFCWHAQQSIMFKLAPPLDCVWKCCASQFHLVTDDRVHATCTAAWKADDVELQFENFCMNLMWPSRTLYQK